MNKVILLFLFFILSPFSVNSQEITQTNTDILYREALEAYQTGEFKRSLELTNRGLQLAPKYHDIRILQVRNLWALQNFEEADNHLDYLLKNAPDYIDVKPLAFQRINKYEDPEEGLKFLERLDGIYTSDNELGLKKAQLLNAAGRLDQARELALELIKWKGLSGGERYGLQTILNRTVISEIGINYQYIGFNENYSRNEPWHYIAAEYQHNLSRTALIGRVTFADRSYEQGKLYEVEAYPVFNDRLYAFTNVGFSDGTLFPDFRTGVSMFYNFAKAFEAETGGRMLFYNNNSYFTGILGLTAYSGKFYLNLRSFLGPQRSDQLVQNYQFNVRYYLTNADNYLFLRLGSGISPDETALSTQIQENPTLDAWYGNFGINKTIGIHHIFQIGTGILYEDITSERQGTQIIGIAGYRYRF